MMKLIIRRSYFTLIIILLGLSSCEDNNPVAEEFGEITFDFSVAEDRGRVEMTELSKIIYSLEDENGDIILEDAEVSISYLGDKYLGDPISLKVGNYSLVKFLVAGENDEILYATPLASSELSYLVDNPLPISFSLSVDESLKITPEVVSTLEGTEVEFGYSQLSFNIINTFDLLLAAFVYDSGSELYELSDASLEISNSGNSVYQTNLFAATNKIVLSERFENLTLKISKEGYFNFEQNFTLDSLKSYDGTTVHGSLEIILQSLSLGLEAYYPFSGNAIDGSGNGNDGIVSGAVLTSDRFGNPNSAYIFDGVDDRIDINNLIQSLSSTSQGSISFWTNLPNLPSSGAYSFLSFGDQSSRSYINTYIDSNGLLRFTSVKNNIEEFFVISDNSELTTNQWHHLVFVQDGIQPKIYLNGTPIETTNNSSNDLSAWFEDFNVLDNSVIGSLDQNFKVQWFLNGSLDELRVYSRALSQDEISHIYNNVE